MFLKKIELIGFKSFPDKMTIDFVPGVTAIVGPNGSGKSNIIDAIRWVLGEQSVRSLRGQKMEDVIFSGSDTRKKVNMAEVSLVLDNTSGQFPISYSEVKVTRKVTRSGDSTFYLNNERCRLKDITDLFVDSGVGKAAFSIISQGRVDEVLNSSPVERRLIFDEAAGVLKYRKRKEEATNKLNKTSEHLERVLDILNELNQQLEPLRISSEKAKKAARLDEALTQLDRDVLQYDVFHQTEQYEQLEKQLVESESEQQQLSEAVAKDHEEVERYQGTRDQLQERREQIQQQIADLQAAVEKWEGRKLLTHEQAKHKKERVEQLQFTVQSTAEQQQKLEEERDTLQSELQQLEQQAKQQQERVEQLERALDTPIDELEQQLEQLKSVYIDRLNEEATIRNDLKHAEQQLTTQKMRTTNDAKAEQLKRRQEEAIIQYDKLDEAWKQNESARMQAKEQLEQLTAMYEDNRKKLAMQEQLVKEASERVIEWRSRLQVLESIEQQFKSYTSSVQEVLKASNRQALKGIHGAVSQLVEAQEERVVKAIETALGATSQQIVTADEASAKAAIRYLKERTLGRATFLPMSTIRGRSVSPSDLQAVQQMPEYVGVASELVRYESSYEAIIQSILGRTLVAETLDGATVIAKRLNYRYRVVTLDGDVVNSGGSLTGGRGKGRPSPFMQKEELHATRKRVAQLQRDIEEAERHMEVTKRQTNAAFEQAQRERAHYEKLSAENRTLEIERLNCKAQKDQHVANYEQYEMQLKETTASVTAMTEQREKLQSEHEKLQKTIEEMKEEISRQTQLLTERRTEHTALTEQYYTARSTCELSEEKLQSVRQQLQRVQKEWTNVRKAAEKVESELTLIENDELEQFTSEEIEQHLQQTTDDLNAAQRALTELQEQQRHTSDELRQLEEGRARRQHQLTETEQRVTETKVALAKIETTLRALVEQLQTKYGIYGRIEQCPEIESIDDSRERLAKMKEERKQIGPVDPSTIEQYEEVLERHTFLSEQRTDLIEAKITLQDAMEEMDEEVEQRFIVTFRAIRHHFQDIFTKMFGGGEADLKLTDPNNLLETGVDIVARPPGKKLQNLSLLSGGERALTAITLLFALIEARPVPFCILDEVEAALDEVNVLRYSDYLKHFSTSTQFIVITHRKGTMEGADVLYGVTMEEAGVSTMLSVQLSEVEEKIGLT